MRRRSLLLSPQAGLTRAGLTLVITITTIVVIAAVPVFRLTQERFSSPKTQAAMRAVGQDALDQMADDLTQAKRIFSNTPADTAFLTRTTMSEAGAVMPGSLLPHPEDRGTVVASTRPFVTARVGNRLLFVRADEPVTLASGVTIDTYFFQGYYLSLDETKRIAGAPSRELWEWKSRRYAREEQITSIVGPRARAEAVLQLVSSGITSAWSPAATNVSKAFSLLSGEAMTPDPNHLIAEGAARRMISISEGMISGGYRLGVSPNNGRRSSTRFPVPKFAVAAGDFPSGFEVVVAGPREARQIFMRLVLAAQGRFSGNISSEGVTLVTLRDLW